MIRCQRWSLKSACGRNGRSACGRNGRSACGRNGRSACGRNGRSACGRSMSLGVVKFFASRSFLLT